MNEKLFILYGSQTGTAEELAHEFNKLATNKNFETKLLELDDVSMKELEDIKKLAVITSTTGDGEVPDNGFNFWENLSKSDKLNLSQLKYGVLALGDSSHYDFCNAGKIIDERLKHLGANRVIDRQECDYETEGSMEWSEKFLNIIKD